MNSKNYNNALQSGYKLLWYRIEDVLGQGAFGITYLAHDINLDRQVAIKEYMPGQFSMRLEQERIEPISDDLQSDYKSGLKRFLSEARTLTKFKHPNLVQVFNIFEKNNTAYMVMSYETGKSLKQILKTRKSLGELELMRILVPLMDGLEMMHDKGFIHRDVKPGNIFIRADNTPVLLDFGSARQTHYYFSDDEDEESQVKTLTNFVSPGYTPIEQYTGKSNRQGPWTDIYALGATLYKCIAGKMPIEAIERSESIVHVSKDEYIKLTDIAEGRYSKSFLSAIDHSLAFKAQHRPQSIKDWKMEFGITEDDIDTIQMSEVHKEKLESNLAKLTSGDDTIQTESTTQHAEQTATEETSLFIKQDEHLPKRKINKQQTLLPYAVAASFLIMLFYFYNGHDIGSPESSVDKEPDLITKKINTPKVEVDNTNSQSQKTSSYISSKQFFNTTVEQTNKPKVTTALSEKELKERIAEKRRRIEIDKLLSMAAEDVIAKRYTLPRDNNAYDKYKQVLALDNQNNDARKGILLLTDKFMISTYQSIEDKDFSKARYYIVKADELSPGLNAVERAKLHLERKEKEHKLALLKESQSAIPKTVQAPKPTATSNDGVKVVDLSRNIPEEQTDSIPDNEIDRTLHNIKKIFE